MVEGCLCVEEPGGNEALNLVRFAFTPPSLCLPLCLLPFSNAPSRMPPGEDAHLSCTIRHFPQISSKVSAYHADPIASLSLYLCFEVSISCHSMKRNSRLNLMVYYCPDGHFSGNQRNVKVNASRLVSNLHALPNLVSLFSAFCVIVPPIYHDGDGESRSRRVAPFVI